jgi:hypothetical protein
MRLWKSKFTDQKVRYLLEIWRQDAAGASLEQANAGEKEERQRERPRKIRKNKGFKIFSVGNLDIFFLPAENFGNYRAK